MTVLDALKEEQIIVKTIIGKAKKSNDISTLKKFNGILLLNAGAIKTFEHICGLISQ